MQVHFNYSNNSTALPLTACRSIGSFALRSIIHSNQPPIGFLSLKLPPPACAVHTGTINHTKPLRTLVLVTTTRMNHYIHHYITTFHRIWGYALFEGSLEAKLPTIWRDENAVQLRRSSDMEKVRRKKMQVREKVGKSRNTVFFQCFVAPEGRKVGSLKRRVRR